MSMNPRLGDGWKKLENFPIDLIRSDFPGHNGARIALHEMGQGRPVILLHGLFSSAYVNWIKYGHAAAIAARGFRVIMPDFRAHGESAASHDPADYPCDVLALDVEALVTHLGLSGFDLGGFSLGARTTGKLLARGMKPRRAILAGMGLEGLSGWASRRDFFLTAIAERDNVKRGDPHWMAVQFMKTMKIDPEAAALLLASFGDVEADELPAISTPALVVCGSEDRDNGSPQALVAALADARLVEVPGTHMSSVTMAELGQAIADFLDT